MIKNEILSGIVESIGSNGEGIIKKDGMVVFVPYALSGEEITYKVLKAEKKLAYGKLLEIKNPSSDRTDPICASYTKCGGCNLQHIKYDLQLEIKRNIVKNCFSKIARLNVDVKPTVKSDLQFRYRNKLQLPVGFDGEKTVIGFYVQNSHRVVDIEDCYINPEWTKDVIRAFREFVRISGIKGYEKQAKDVRLREITVKSVKNKLMIVAVVTREQGFNSKLLQKVLEENLSLEFSLFLNVNSGESNVIYGEKFIKICGEDKLIGEMDGISYETGVLSFMQVNDNVCKKLYGAVIDYIGEECETVIDAYSGAGLMTALLARKTKKAIGIEIIKEATEKANELAKINGLDDKITNYCGKCEELLPEIIKNERKTAKKLGLVLDPPRKGCDKAVIDAIKTSKPDVIVYVSCLPSTLARDIGLLVGTLVEENGEIVKAQNPVGDYVIESVRGFDMFAQTKHMETLVCLTRK